MKVYAYQAALLCEACGKGMQTYLSETIGREDTGDSDRFPQGPYDDGGGEADSPQHCDRCCIFLENPLTPDGVNYVRTGFCAAQWKQFYSGSYGLEWPDN